MARLGRNDACWCGSGKKYKACHEEFDRKIEVFRNQGHLVPEHRLIKNPMQIAKIKEACKVNVEILDTVADKICIGMSTEDINKIVNEVTYRNNAIPAPLNYEGFPKSVCTSINDAVCHGIPSEDEILMDGDIINVDVSTILDGYFADSSRMFMMGNVSDEDRKLVENYLRDSSDHAATKSRVAIAAIRQGLSVSLDTLLDQVIQTADPETVKETLEAFCINRLSDEDVIRILSFAYECGNLETAFYAMDCLKNSGQFVLVPSKLLIAMLSNHHLNANDKESLLKKSFEFKIDNKSFVI